MIYLDHNASTPLDPGVLEAMRPWLSSHGANPSSAHAEGRKARHAIDVARQKVAAAVNCHEEEVIFTHSGTEANNLAILGGLPDSSGSRLVTCSAEHSSVLGPAKHLEAHGAPVVYAGVDSSCRVRIEEVLQAAREKSSLVSLALANNEVGALQPIDEIRRKLPDGVLFHCDAVQAVGKVPVDFQKLGIDFLSLSAHKFYGPPGAAALIVRKGRSLKPLLFGGSQEYNLWPGTENLPSVVGLGFAIEKSVARISEYEKQTSQLTQKFRTFLQNELPAAQINSPEVGAIPNTCSVTFPGVEGRSLLIQLDLEGLAVSLGSACASGSLLPSHVLIAMGKSRQEALASVRFSFGWGNEISDFDFLAQCLKTNLQKFPDFADRNEKTKQKNQKEY